MRALLLDALGTLVELHPPAAALRRQLAGRFDVVVSHAEASAAIAAEVDYYRDHLNAGRDAAGLAALRSSCAEALRAALPPSDTVTAIDNAALVDALLASLRFRAFDDVRPALMTARAQGMRLVVVSNWDVSLHEVLEAVGLAPLLDAVLTSAEAGARKPDPAIFELALELAGVPRHEALHVGDSLGEDVAGARAAGIEAVLLARDGRRGTPQVRTIAGLQELFVS